MTDLKKDKTAQFPPAVRDAMAKEADVLRLTSEDDRDYYFKKPKQMDMNRFLGTSGKGKLASAVKNLVYDMAISPSKSELKAEFKEMPGRIVALNNAIQTSIGLNEDFSVKKL